MKRFFVGLAAASALFSGVSSAEDVAYDDRMYGGAAYQLTDTQNGKRPVQDSRQGIKLFVGKKFSPSFGGELYGSYATFDTAVAGGVDAEEASVGADLMWYPIKCSDSIQPFAKVGLGATAYESEPSVYPYAMVGGGAFWKLTDNGTALRTDVGVKAFRESDTTAGSSVNVFELVANVGISVPFGDAPSIDEGCPVVLPWGVEEKAEETSTETTMEAAPVAPSKTPQQASADADNDGVIDAADKCANTAAGVKVDVNGCPVPETVVIYFAFDSAELNSAAKAALDRVAANLNNRTFVVAIANGHADATGTEEYNMGLSERRAASVANYLSGKGVAGSMIRKRAYGEARPAADNDTEIGRAKNRRVEVNLLRQ